ncbi:MAG TPA: oligosaccharide flippase family protein [Kofleriaceae bacterium]|nr:oligosaccharide flippase family protein [Kofleriaceae bacterium]
MSVGKRATRGAIWNVGASTGTRAIGLIGTLFMTRLLRPDVIGEVSAASVIAQTANWLSHWGFNQYMIVHGPKGDEQTYHASVVNLAFGFVGLCAIAGTGEWFAPMFNAPHLASYLPGLTLAILLRRIGAVPDKVLARELRFRELAIANGAGDLAYTISAITLAATTNLGGQAIVIGNIIQSAIASLLVFRATGMGWLRRTPWRWERVREILRFGLPLGVAQVFDFATRYWDNLAFGAYFGPKIVGFYNMAYNLADIPAVQVGEQIGSVLLPAMGGLDLEDRKAALIRSTGLMALAIFPLAVGLGTVAPTLIRIILNDAWQGVAPLLTVLSVLSVVRPMAWGVASYLASFSRTKTLMLLALLKLVLLFGCIVAFSRLGPVWTAVSVGIAFGGQALVSIVLIICTDAIPAWPLASGVLRPLAASAVMAAAVLGARHGMEVVGLGAPKLVLPVEIVVGVVSYLVAAFVLAGPIARDFLRLLRRALRRDG